MAVVPKHLTGDKEGIQQFIDQYDVSVRNKMSSWPRIY